MELDPGLVVVYDHHVQYDRELGSCLPWNPSARDWRTSRLRRSTGDSLNCEGFGGGALIRRESRLLMEVRPRVVVWVVGRQSCG